MKIDLVKKMLVEGEFDYRLVDLYNDENQATVQKERYIKAVDRFSTLFNDTDITIFSTPGRTEVCGNHTDHQKGRVIAAAVNLDMIAVASPADDVKVYSDGYDIETITLGDFERREEETGSSISLIRGILAGFEKEGYTTGGFHAYITSDILEGSGLSSSAAFEVMIGTIISGLYHDTLIDPVENAKIGQYSENNYYGKPCGLMDQCACAIGGMIFIDFNRGPRINQIDVDFDRFGRSLCIIDAHATHSDLTEDYACIPEDMRKVARFFGRAALADVDEEDFYESFKELRQRVGDRPVLRAYHFFTENKRVNDAAFALRYNDYVTFREIISESGDSSFKFLQNIYSEHDVDHQAIALALAMAESVLRNHGVCRVHGGGFAGTIQAFVDDDFVERFKQKMDNYFGEGSCRVLKIRNQGAGKVIG
ncbi:MAG: galactokinase [Erysipelotrichaceae bacterium]|nr:galactokinase [Erysipelotrichaceae bacterium]